VNPLTPEALLWKEAQEGDPHALDHLLRATLPAVLAWCRRLSGPGVDAEQAAQEVGIVLLRRLHTIGAPEQLPSWLFSTTRKVLAGQRRKAWLRRWVPGVRVEDVTPSSPPQVEQRLEAEAVRGVVATLPEDLRPDPEVARLLGIPDGTVKSRLRRARALFRDRARAAGLAPDGGGP
jgi:RNA polymerase sigma-70 factor (ECF subfamily)